MRKVLAVLLVTFLCFFTISATVLAAPPTINMVTPDSKSFDNPTILPQNTWIVWDQYDPDPGTSFTQFFVSVVDRETNVTYYHSNIQPITRPNESYGAHQIPVQLPTDITLIVVVGVWNSNGEFAASSGVMQIYD